jgi:hypothetical protein
MGKNEVSRIELIVFLQFTTDRHRQFARAIVFVSLQAEEMLD